MLTIVSVSSVLAGTVMSYLAERMPSHVEAIETCAGFLLIGGFALIGAGLPCLL